MISVRVDAVMPSLPVACAALAVALATPAGAGAAWRAPQDLRGPVSLSVPHVAVAARGDAVVAWRAGQSRIVAALRRGDRSFAVARVIARAHPRGRLFDPEVAIGPSGDAIVVWAEAAPDAPRYRIRAAIAVGARRFDGARIIGRSTTALRAQPRVVPGPSGDAIAGWYRDDVGLQLAVRRPGARFGRPRTALTLPYTTVAWAVARDARLHLAWTASSPQGSFIARSSGRLGGRFSLISPVGPAGASSPLIAAAPNGALVLAYRAGVGVGATTAPPGRTLFGPDQVLSTPAASAATLRLAVGPHGSAAVTWGGTGGGWPSSTHPGVLAWIAVRAPGQPFAAAEALAPVDAWAQTPVAAFDADGVLTAATVRADGGVRRLAIFRGTPGVPLAAPALTSTATVGEQVHIAHNAAAVASAGGHTVVAWSTGVAGPVRVFAFRPASVR